MSSISRSVRSIKIIGNIEDLFLSELNITPNAISGNISESGNSQSYENNRISDYLRGTYKPTYHSTKKVHNPITHTTTTSTSRNSKYE